MLHEQVPGDRACSHVLLVKSGGGSMQETVDDRPLWFKDRFSVVAVAGLTYMLLDVNQNVIVAAGCATGSAAGTGTIGGDFDVKVKPGPV